jgi:hypothetical protein
MDCLESLKCSIYLEIPEPDDAVVLKGYVFSKEAITRHLSTSNKHPVLGEYVSINDIQICPLIKRLCDEYHTRKNNGISRLRYTKKLYFNVTINISYEKIKIFNFIAEFVKSEGVCTFGSYTYLKFYNIINMTEYFNYCKFVQNCNLSLNYEDNTFHPSSYLSRMELQEINDIDIYIYNPQLRNIYIKLIDTLTKKYNADV